MFALPKKNWEKKRHSGSELDILFSKWLTRHYFTVVGTSNSAPSQTWESVVSGAELIEKCLATCSEFWCCWLLVAGNVGFILPWTLMLTASVCMEMCLSGCVCETFLLDLPGLFQSFHCNYKRFKFVFVSFPRHPTYFSTLLCRFISGWTEPCCFSFPLLFTSPTTFLHLPPPAFLLTTSNSEQCQCSKINILTAARVVISLRLFLICLTKLCCSL